MTCVFKSDVLIVVDVQNDFCTGGLLPVHGGELVVPCINRIRSLFTHVVFSQDYHGEGHASFSSSALCAGAGWPDHCIAGTVGALLHKDLVIKGSDIILRKGIAPDVDAYSIFNNNDHDEDSGLASFFKRSGCHRLFFAGIARDICVYHLMIDACRYGFEVYLIWDATEALNQSEDEALWFKARCEENKIYICYAEELVS